MNIRAIIRCLAIVVSLGVAAGAAADIPPSGGGDRDRSGTGKTQVGFAQISVNGRSLTGPNSAAQRRDGRLLLPVASLSRSLGDSVLIFASTQSINVTRQNGTMSSFDFKLGQVSENGVTVLTIASRGDIIFNPYVEELLLPVEIVAALFDVAIRFDQVRNIVLVTRGITGLVSKQKIARSFLDLYLADYEYNINRYAATNSHSLALNAIGRLADGRFSLIANGASSRGRFRPRNFTFDLTRPNGQRYVVGDLGTGSVLPLLTSNIRGAMVSVPVGSVTVSAFGGVASSGTFSRSGQSGEFPPQNRYSFDTKVFGTAVSAKPFDKGSLRPLSLSAGVTRFSGRSRSGSLASTSANYSGQHLQMQADFALGTFRGVSLDGRAIDAPAGAYDLAASYQASSKLSFQGRVAHVGANFLSAQSGVREPVDVKSGGVAWSPVKWLTGSISATTTGRPYETGRSDRYVTSAFTITPGVGRPQVYLSHTESSSRAFKSGQFTLLNVAQTFRRTRLFLNATRVRNTGAATIAAQFGAAFMINDKNTVEVNQGVASRKNYNGVAEWRSDGLISNRLSFSAGLGYNYSNGGGFRGYEKLTATLALPRSTSVHLNYYQNGSNPTVMLQVRGSLFRRREAAAYLAADQAEVNEYGGASGRVYQDIDGNGKFDAGVDKPQPNVKVRMDGSLTVETDANGLFAFASVLSGSHKVSLDLLSLRADLTLIDGDGRDLEIEAGRNSQFDFRVVRTGRIAGRVFYDKNENGTFDDGEVPLSDIRIVTASGRDTLTDTDGYFSIADLPPGEHTILIDEKTLPEKTVTRAKPLAVQVFAGRETSDIFLVVTDRPAEVKMFGSGGKP